MRDFTRTLSIALWTGALVVRAEAQTTIDPSRANAWSANLGWINWHAGGASGAVIGEYTCRGYLYGANVGWISLGNGAPRNGIYYQNRSAADFGVNRETSGALSGLAYSPNLGWLCFTNRDSRGIRFDGPRVDLFTGQLSGFVYSANAGWFSLSNAVASVRTQHILVGRDQDADGLPDDWELSQAGSLETLTATGDADADGAPDLEEYWADTHPLLAGDRLEISIFRPEATRPEWLIVWPSKPTRYYYLRQQTDVAGAAQWEDSGFGQIFPDADYFIMRLVTNSPLAPRFFRVEAVRPL